MVGAFMKKPIKCVLFLHIVRKRMAAIALWSVISIALASNGSISVTSTNRASAATNQYRWDPVRLTLVDGR